MMVPGGLSLEVGLTQQTGPAPAQEMSADTGFTEILATLDAVMVAIAPTLDGAVPMSAPAGMTPVPEAEAAPNEAAGDEEEGDADATADLPADDSVAPPFVAPPIAIGVSSASPIIVDRTFVAPRGGAAISQKAAADALVVPVPAEPAAEIVVPTSKAVRPEALLAAFSAVKAGMSPFTVPVSPVPLPGSKADQPVDIAIVNAAAIASGTDLFATAALPDALAVSTPVTVTTPGTPDAFRLADVAPDTARRLGEQAMAARLDMADETAMIDRLARDIAQLSGAEGRLKFQLNPEHLGSLHVEVEHRAEGVSLRFGTETEGARQVIADAQHRLVNEARAQGMRIAETHVDLSGQNQQGSNRGDQAPQPLVITRGETPDASARSVPARRASVERFA